jgi:hypothetical protein
MAESQLSREELDQRVAVLRRFRALLVEQRNRFRGYLEELDRQQGVIKTGSAEELVAHVELEEKIVADIFAVQKVIEPLDRMYRSVSARAGGDPPGGETEVLGLKSALEGLKQEAVLRSTRNKDLLSRRMTEIREEITALRANPYHSGGYPPGNRPATPSLVDISG